MERQFIDWLASHVPTSPRLAVGLGDDAAVLRWTAEDKNLVVTTDTVTDQVDFILADVGPALAGRKALAVNLSDLAAMAAEPVAAFVSLVLPRGGVGSLSVYELALELYQGMLPLAEEYGITIAGGDTNVWEGPLVVSVTALGRTTDRGPLTRSGARPGDAVLVTGSLGGSILGHHLKFDPRVREALALHARYSLRAGMDISDGLALDASRLATASGCGVELDLAAIPLSPAAQRLSATTGRTPLDQALGDGEDFELLLVAPPEAASQMIKDQPLQIPITRIGECIDKPGLWQVDGSGELRPLAPIGFEH